MLSLYLSVPLTQFLKALKPAHGRHNLDKFRWTSGSHNPAATYTTRI